MQNESGGLHMWIVAIGRSYIKLSQEYADGDRATLWVHSRQNNMSFVTRIELHLSPDATALIGVSPL